MNNEDKYLNEKLKAKFNELFSDFEEDLPEPDGEINTIYLFDENDEEVEFELLDLLSYEGEEYVVVLPVEDSDEPGEVVILKFEENKKDDDALVSVDNDVILKEVFNIFKEKFKNKFNFVD